MRRRAVSRWSLISWPAAAPTILVNYLLYGHRWMLWAALVASVLAFLMYARLLWGAAE